MAHVTATPCNGVNMPLDHFAVRREVSGEREPFLIGRAVKAAVNKAQQSGVDTTKQPFLVIVTFD